MISYRMMKSTVLTISIVSILHSNHNLVHAKIEYSRAQNLFAGRKEILLHDGDSASEKTKSPFNPRRISVQWRVFERENYGNKQQTDSHAVIANARISTNHNIDKECFEKLNLRGGKVESNIATQEDSNRAHHLTPPKLNLQPRKNELWLPWPLDALKNDYFRFVEEHQMKNEEHRKSQQHQQNGSSKHENQQQRMKFIQGRNWMERMSRKKSFLPFSLLPSHHQDKSLIEPPQPRYWIKDTTTSMAAASAAIIKEKPTQQMQQKRIKNNNGQNDTRGVESGESIKRRWDHEIFVKFLKLQASVRLRQLEYVASDFSVHLPPSSPALLLLYMMPSKHDPFRRLVKFSLTGAALSWIHSETTKYRRFAPLPTLKGINARRPELLPFLPEVVIEKESANYDFHEKTRDGKIPSDYVHSWDPFSSFGTISSAYQNWLERQSIRNRQLTLQRRIKVQAQLLELHGSSTNLTAISPSKASNSNNSYALITGASRGIGRALAVELARYGIPVILVARDMSRLRKVAKDIETYYKVPCHILQADLTSLDCASRIHSATKKAGLNVDILINNAGVCNQGEMIEGDIDEIIDMIHVNVGSVALLSRLYGREMKKRRRGRMLFVSSMSGALPGCPSVAVYAATKSFEKTLASSLGREMEKYGIGITCLLPGAVRDTDFASRSDVEDAVCFQIPGYAKAPEFVAREGIKAMMLGYPEVYPGWENKIFTKICLPMLPSRFASLIGAYAWSSWQWGVPQIRRESRISTKDDKGFSPSSSMDRNPDKWKHTMETATDGMPSSFLSQPDGKIDDNLSIDEYKPQTDGVNLESFKVLELNTDACSTSTLALPNSNKDEPMSNFLLLPPLLKSSESSSSQANFYDCKVYPSEPLFLDESHGMNNNDAPNIANTVPRNIGSNNDHINEEIESFPLPSTNEILRHPSMLDLKEYDFRDRRLAY